MPKNGGGRDWKPGESGNPNGRPRLPGDIKEARLLNRIELERIINRFLHMSVEQIKFVAESPDSTALELMIGSIIQKAVINGDPIRLDFILNRIVGKVKEQVEITMPKPVVIERRDGSQTWLGAEKKKDEDE